MSTIPSTNEDLFGTVLRFSDHVHVALDDENERIFVALSSLSDVVRKESDRWAGKLPYHINLLDIWGPNEPAHSRILLQILRYKTQDGRFEFFESLIDYIQKRDENFSKIEVGTPYMTAEKERIDVCIREHGKYAIIFENKSNWAKDQPSQLVRYIKKMRDHYGYKEDQIYVLYLPPYSSKKPEAQSWIDLEDPDNPEVDFKPRFEKRYMNFSFYEGIIPWLKQKVLPNIRNKDAYLLSALTQYVDYWDGYFGQRAGEKEKNMSIETIVKEKMGISNDSADPARLIEDFKKVQQKISDFDMVRGCLENLKNDMAINLQSEFWNDLTQQLKNRGHKVKGGDELLNKVTAYYKEGKENAPGLDLEFSESKVTKKPYLLAIEIGWNGFWYGVCKRKCGESDNDMEECLKRNILGAVTDDDWWFSFKFPSPEDALNWRTLDSPGFDKLTTANLKEREAFIGGLANEIDNYIKGVRCAMKESGL